MAIGEDEQQRRFDQAADAVYDALGEDFPFFLCVGQWGESEEACRVLHASNIIDAQVPVELRMMATIIEDRLRQQESERS